MNDLLASLEASTLGDAMRGAGVWAYALVNLAHIVGVATLFGSVLLLDLRLLGVWSSVPLRSISTPAVPVARASTRNVSSSRGIRWVRRNRAS